jgi:hypothetical protein
MKKVAVVMSVALLMLLTASMPATWIVWIWSHTNMVPIR